MLWILCVILFVGLIYVGPHKMSRKPQTKFESDALRFLLEEAEPKTGYYLGGRRYQKVQVIKEEKGCHSVIAHRYNLESSDFCTFDKYGLVV